MDREKRGLLLVAAGAALISFSAVFVRMTAVGPTAAGFYRMLFGSLVLLPLVLIRRGFKSVSWRPLLYMLACAALFSIDLAVWHRAIHYLGPGLATLLGNFQVVVLAVAGMAFLGERADWRVVLAIPLALLGLLLIVSPDQSRLSGDFGIGILLALLTAVAYAVFLLTMRWVRDREQAIGATASIALVSIFCLPMLGTAGMAFGESFDISRPVDLGAMIAYGVLCQALGWVLISRGIPAARASRVGIILLLQPVLSLVWDYLFFAKPILPLEVAGATLALAAIYLGAARREEKQGATVGAG